MLLIPIMYLHEIYMQKKFESHTSNRFLEKGT